MNKYTSLTDSVFITTSQRRFLREEREQREIKGLQNDELIKDVSFLRALKVNEKEL